MNDSMELRGFSTSTKKTNLGHNHWFAEFSKKHPAACGYEDVRAFLLYAKDFLGHRNIQNTAKYLHLIHAQVLGIKSLFDQMRGNPDA